MIENNTPAHKGNITNIPLILVATLSLTIAVLTSATILGSIQDATSEEQISQEPLEQGQAALSIFDVGIVFVNAAFYLVGIVLGVKVRTSPVFALPALIFLGVSVWLSSEVANIYGLFGQAGPLQGAAGEFVLVEQFMSNLPVITLGLGGLMLLVLYSGVGRAEVTA